jgi:hypothetical protein
MGTLHEDLYMLMIMPPSVLLIMRNFSERVCTENQNTHFMSNKCFLLKFVAFKRLCGKGRQATDDNMAHALCVLDN